MSDVLGLDHPLTRACAALDTTIQQLLIVAAIFAASIAAALDRSTIAPSVAVAAALVLAGFGVAALSRAQTRRDRVLDLIVEGRENLPVTLVQRERRRLASPKLRRGLAGTLESMVEETLRPCTLAFRSARPVLSRSAVVEAQADVREVVGLLRGLGATVRGVAFTERLVTRGDSVLYGHDIAALRDGLRRARVLLERG